MNPQRLLLLAQDYGEIVRYYIWNHRPDKAYAYAKFAAYYAALALGTAPAMCHICGQPCPLGKNVHQSCVDFEAWIEQGGTLD